MSENQNIVDRLRIRATIRRQAKGRKSVEEGKPDRLADLLDEAANEIERMTRRSMRDGDRPNLES